MKSENLDAFKEKFHRFVSQTIDDEILIPEIEIDILLNFSQIAPKFLRILKQFAPFGPGNMAPIFRTDQVVDTGRIRVVGKNHLKLELMQLQERSDPISAIAFQQGDHFKAIKSGRPFSVCYHIEENEWQGKINMQLNVKDIQFFD